MKKTNKWMLALVIAALSFAFFMPQLAKGQATTQHDTSAQVTGPGTSTMVDDNSGIIDPDALANEPPGKVAEKSKRPPPIDHLEVYLAIGLLFFGLLVILIELYLARVTNMPPQDIIKFILITLIIISALYLITCGYTNDQIAPAVGLLGTIAGYLLGKNTVESKGDRQKPSEGNAEMK